MVRGGRTSRRIGQLVACATAAVAVAAPATASGQSAVDEYTLDIPQAGGGAGGGSGTDPTAGATPGGGGSVAGGGAGPGGNGTNAASGGVGNGPGENVDFSALHHGGEDAESVGAATGARSAPEVAADALFDSAMLPVLAALALITGLGAWRVFRGRWTLSGEAG
jgi:hypothetical protein